MSTPTHPPNSSDEEVFQIAASISDPDARQKYLESVCAGDEARLQHLTKLLDAQDQADSLLDQTPSVSATVKQPSIAAVGDKVGPYKLLQKIGEGGFGTVYMAEQTEPVRRKVALKMIKPGMDSKDIIARFEAERQALALMDHPNIAKVLDAGTTDSGYPYFVMELVKGVSITEFADSSKLSTKERLALFIDICRAVQHAHQKGVIHRDIKPSNVMVTLHDGKPVPKVIDFGVAKALSQPLTEKTLFTRYGQAIGTLLYMSPEQAEMSGLDIDTRADVYSLGVILYELLTGRTPFTSEEIRRAGEREMLRLICETEPLKPSRALLTFDNDTATAVATHRSSKPDSLTRLVRGELDGIVMKCLEKERHRRYDTATALAEDIQRHLNDEPINIPSSWGYRVAKTVRRHKVAFATTAVVIGSLLIGLVGTFAALNEVKRQSEIARKSERTAQDAQDRATAARDLANRREHDANIERQSAEQAFALMVEILEKSGTNPSTGKDYTVPEALEDLAAQALVTNQKDSSKKNQKPRLRFPPKLVQDLNFRLGESYSENGRYDLARQHNEVALEMSRKIYGKEDERTTRCMRQLGYITINVEMLQQAAEIEDNRGDNSSRSRTLTRLGRVFLHLGRIEEAEKALVLACDLYDPSDRRIELSDIPFLMLARVYRLQQRKDEEDAQTRRAIEEAITKFGNENWRWRRDAKSAKDRFLSEYQLLVADHLWTSDRPDPPAFDLAQFYERELQLEHAEWFCRRSIKSAEEGDHRYDLGQSYSQLAKIFLKKEEWEASRQYVNKALQIMLQTEKKGLFADLSGPLIGQWAIDEEFRKTLRKVAQPLFKKLNTPHSNLTPSEYSIGMLTALLDGDEATADRCAARLENQRGVMKRLAVRQILTRLGKVDLGIRLTQYSRRHFHDESKEDAFWELCTEARYRYLLGDLETAEQILREGYRLAHDSLSSPFAVQWSTNELAYVLEMRGKDDEAKQLYADLLSELQELQNEGKTVWYRNDMDRLTRWVAELKTETFADFEKLRRLAFETLTLTAAPNESVADRRNWLHIVLARYYQTRGELKKEILEFERSVQFVEDPARMVPDLFWEDHLVDLYLENDMHARGQVVFQQAVKKRERLFGKRCPVVAFTRIRLCKLMLADPKSDRESITKHLAEAEAMLSSNKATPKHVLDEIAELKMQAES